MSGIFLRKPNNNKTRHVCDLPRIQNEPFDEPSYPLGTIWGCLVCFKRYKLVYRDGFGVGHYQWVRRWLPWPTFDGGY